ncbi:MAG: hypothetical protein BAA01_05060 [Bacillus thermozeamaize]|uniref:HTH rpiR-type domain-containing protein n=1 Tax=Bacillus thermozeamaize TaxID=230954 RepID=A0A1Y3PNE2_9BACI|nr:MAG: hypothetical protein BAA01_05060 [Bacillus thermozeamaize]
MNDEVKQLALHIRNQSAHLTKSQKEVAEYILTHPQEMTYLTAAQIGKEVGVSETTVIRTAMNLGYRKFSDLQEAYQAAFGKKRTLSRLEESTTGLDSIPAALHKSFQQDLENIRSTLESIDHEQFQQFIQRITEARNIFVIGSRSTSADAFFLGFNLNNLLGNVHTVTSLGPDMEDCFRYADEQSLAIGFGYPRYAKKTVDALRYLKHKKATITVITDSIRSPLLELGDFSFLTEIKSYTSVDSHAASFALINAIISAVSYHAKERVVQMLNLLEDYYADFQVFSGK